MNLEGWLLHWCSTSTHEPCFISLIFCIFYNFLYLSWLNFFLWSLSWTANLSKTFSLVKTSPLLFCILFSLKTDDVECLKQYLQMVCEREFIVSLQIFLKWVERNCFRRCNACGRIFSCILLVVSLFSYENMLLSSPTKLSLV